MPPNRVKIIGFNEKSNDFDALAKILGSRIQARATKPYQKHMFLIRKAMVFKSWPRSWDPGSRPGLPKPIEIICFTYKNGGLLLLAKILGPRIRARATKPYQNHTFLIRKAILSKSSPPNTTEPDRTLLNPPSGAREDDSILLRRSRGRYVQFGDFAVGEDDTFE